jgi:outer membrane protein assembly factor BamB
MFMRNGPVVTAVGLIFIASGPDRMIHALDKDTGKTLWETEIDANPDGIPAVYEVGGREYVAFSKRLAEARSPLPTSRESQAHKDTTFSLYRERKARTSETHGQAGRS